MTDIEALKPYGLVWNKRYDLLICTKCHFGVVKSEALGHFKNSHPELISEIKDSEFQDLVSNSVPEDNTTGQPKGDGTEGENHTWPIVQGLYVHRGITCKLCWHTVLSDNSMNTHWYRHHKGWFC